MKNITRLLCVGASALALTGCPGKTKVPESVYSKPKTEVKVKVPKRIDYFANLPPSSGDSSPFVINGDFDGDEDLDLILVQKEDVITDSNKTRAYFFENDGKGNFTLRTYPDPRGLTIDELEKK